MKLSEVRLREGAVSQQTTLTIVWTNYSGGLGMKVGCDCADRKIDFYAPG